MATKQVNLAHKPLDNDDAGCEASLPQQGQAERQDPYARIFGQRYSSTGKAAGPQVSLQDTLSPDVVLIWDLDETLITFQSLISGSFAAGAPFQVKIDTCWYSQFLPIGS